MFIDDRGIVLKCVKYDDKSFIAHLFTASRGHVAFIVNATHGKRSSGKNARIFQPLSFLSFQYDVKPKAALQRMKEVRLLFVLQDIPYHPIKRSVAMLLSEFMFYTLREEGENMDLYLYLEHSFQWFDMANAQYANFHLVFLLKLARFLGVSPNTDDYNTNYLFDLLHGNFIPTGVPSEIVLSDRDAYFLYILCEANYTTMNTIVMSRQERVRMIEYISTYYSFHIPGFPAIQSLDILRQLLE